MSSLSDWLAAGFESIKEAREWDYRHFGPHAAMLWKKAGFRPPDALLWKQAEFSVETAAAAVQEGILLKDLIRQRKAAWEKKVAEKAKMQRILTALTDDDKIIVGG